MSFLDRVLRQVMVFAATHQFLLGCGFVAVTAKMEDPVNQHAEHFVTGGRTVNHGVLPYGDGIDKDIAGDKTLLQVGIIESYNVGMVIVPEVLAVYADVVLRGRKYKRYIARDESFASHDTLYPRRNCAFLFQPVGASVVMEMYRHFICDLPPEPLLWIEVGRAVPYLEMKEIVFLAFAYTAYTLPCRDVVSRLYRNGSEVGIKGYVITVAHGYTCIVHRDGIDARNGTLEYARNRSTVIARNIHALVIDDKVRLQRMGMAAVSVGYDPFEGIRYAPLIFVEHPRQFGKVSILGIRQGFVVVLFCLRGDDRGDLLLG